MRRHAFLLAATLAATAFITAQCGPAPAPVHTAHKGQATASTAPASDWTPWVAGPVLANRRNVQVRAVAARSAATPRPPLAGWVIVVDPGHGRDPRYGNYTGARGVNGVSEDQNVLDIGQRLVALLRAQGASVYITRGPYDPGPPPTAGLAPRVALAERVHADVFISIHQNDGSAASHGTQTWYYWSKSAALAGDIQQAMVAGTGLANAGIHQKGFYVVYRTSMPSVLVEGGFLSNAAEAARISTTAFHQQEAVALERGILRYAASNPLPGA